jgi:hypothetical protein
MTAATVCLPCENPEYYDDLRIEYHRIFQPKNLVEHDLVDAIVVARWRETRAVRHENCLIRESFAQRRARIETVYNRLSIDVETALAFKAISDDSNALENLDRYERRLRRQSVMAMRQLAEYRRNFPPSENSEVYTPIYLDTENLQTEPIPKNEHQPIGGAIEENTIELRPQPAAAPAPELTEAPASQPEPTADNGQLTTEPEPRPLTMTAGASEFQLTVDRWPLITELTTEPGPLTMCAGASAPQLITDHWPLTTPPRV